MATHAFRAVGQFENSTQVLSGSEVISTWSGGHSKLSTNTGNSSWPPTKRITYARGGGYARHHTHIPGIVHIYQPLRTAPDRKEDVLAWSGAGATNLKRGGVVSLRFILPIPRRISNKKSGTLFAGKTIPKLCRKKERITWRCPEEAFGSRTLRIMLWPSAPPRPARRVMQGAKALLMAFCRKSSLRTQRRFTYTNYHHASQ